MGNYESEIDIFNGLDQAHVDLGDRLGAFSSEPFFHYSP
jgi:hypothetical protein